MRTKKIGNNKKILHNANTAFFSTASAGYALYAATSLLTIRDHIPNAKLYVLSSGLSEKDKKVLDRHDITYHELDLSSAFTKTWEYPIDCYYIFAGPEFLRKQGYDFSVYIDGDVLCAQNPLDGLPEVVGVAGVASAGENKDYTGIFGSDWNKIKKIWSVPQSTAKRKRVNAGVVYFNNHKMEQIGLLRKATNLFQKSLECDIPRKGDDSLFSLLQYVHLSEQEVAILPSRYNFVLQFNKWIYPIKDLVFFHFSIDKPWKQNPYLHEDASLNEFNPLVKHWRSKYKIVSFVDYMRTEYTPFQKIYTIGMLSVRFIDKAKRLLRDIIYWILGYKKSLFMRRSNVNKDPIKLYWWSNYAKGIANFGDEVTKDLLLKIYGYRSVFAPPNEAEVVGAGSILEIVLEQHKDNRPYIWGSGYMWEEDHKGSLDNLVFCAVRGANTKKRLGSNKSSVILGDPGLLASIVYPRSRYQSGKIGVVAHFVDLNEPLVEQIKNDPRFMIINPLRSASDVALSITSCKFVLSSSLHGLIFADSFNIPNAHIRFSDKVAGGTYKFEDYYSAIGKTYSCVDSNKVFDDAYIAELKNSYVPISNLRNIQRSLVKSFPKLR